MHTEVEIMGSMRCNSSHCTVYGYASALCFNCYSVLHNCVSNDLALLQHCRITTCREDWTGCSSHTPRSPTRGCRTAGFLACGSPSSRGAAGSSSGSGRTRVPRWPGGRSRRGPTSQCEEAGGAPSRTFGRSPRCTRKALICIHVDV